MAELHKSASVSLKIATNPSIRPPIAAFPPPFCSNSPPNLINSATDCCDSPGNYSLLVQTINPGFFPTSQNCICSAFRRCSVLCHRLIVKRLSISVKWVSSTIRFRSAMQPSSNTSTAQLAKWRVATVTPIIRREDLITHREDSTQFSELLQSPGLHHSAGGNDIPKWRVATVTPIVHREGFTHSVPPTSEVPLDHFIAGNDISKLRVATVTPIVHREGPTVGDYSVSHEPFPQESWGPWMLFREPTAGPIFPEEALPTKSGYLPVSDTSKSKLFYVFYEATDPSTSLTDTPWLLWLNGGPGCSSLIGCFYELGPWRIREDGFTLQPNEGAWNRRCGILFVDNPVGTGFSVAASDDDVPKDQETVAKHLEYALKYFVKGNPSFRSRPLFLAGESYAGKYIPALAYHLLQQTSSLRSQLVGIAIGNGFTDPRTQVQAHADVLYSFGLLDKQQITFVRDTASYIASLVDREEWLEAHERRTALCNWIEHTSGIKTMLDVRRSSRYHHLQDGTEYLAKFLNSAGVKMQLKVDPKALEWVSCRPSIRALMAQDTMKSTKWMLEEILREGIPVLLYQGMYDVKDGPAGSEAWMRSLHWQGIKAFWESERKVWTENGVLGGYWRNMRNLTHVVCAGAGHQVPADQPIFSQIMIEKWMSSLCEPYQGAKL